MIKYPQFKDREPKFWVAWLTVSGNIGCAELIDADTLLSLFPDILYTHTISCLHREDAIKIAKEHFIKFCINFCFDKEEEKNGD